MARTLRKEEIEWKAWEQECEITRETRLPMIWKSTQTFLSWAGIAGALVGPGSALRARPPDSWCDLEVLFLRLGLGSAGTGNRSLGRGGLFLELRLVVFRTPGEGQGAKTQGRKPKSFARQPHVANPSPLQPP
jgi:hypothetical protein